MDAPSRRGAVRLGERDRSSSIDAQIHSVLVQRGDLVGGHEALACPDTDHDSVKDVFRWGRDHVVDRPNLLAVRNENGHILVQYLVRDRQPLVHPPHTSVCGIGGARCRAMREPQLAVVSARYLSIHFPLMGRFALPIPLRQAVSRRWPPPRNEHRLEPDPSPAAWG